MLGAPSSGRRPKSWLHPSLAYGAGYDEFARAAAGKHTAELERLTAEAEWTVALRRRDGSRWDRLAAIDVGPRSVR